MRLTPVLSAILLMLVVMPALAQSAFETHDQAARRRQAEQYSEEKNRPNLLTQERQRPLGEAAPSRFSNPPVHRDHDGLGRSSGVLPVR